MPTTALERILVGEFRRLHARHAEFRPEPGERPDVANHRRWLHWLALDLFAMELTEHLTESGEIEADGCLIKLDADGRPALFEAGRRDPLRVPRDHGCRMVPVRSPHDPTETFTHAA